LHGSVSGLLLTVGMFETVRIYREETDVTLNNNKQTNFMRPFPFWGSQQGFKLVNATRSAILRSLVAVLGQINAVQVILFYRASIKSFPDYKHLLQENYLEYKHIFF
jgi:hypothetical protein